MHDVPFLLCHHKFFWRDSGFQFRPPKSFIKLSPDLTKRCAVTMSAARVIEQPFKSH